MANDIRWQLGIRWDGSNYLDESGNMIAATMNYSVSAPGTPTVSGGGIISQCNLIMSNADRRYSSNNPDSDLYAWTNYGEYHHREMYLNVSIDGGSNYYRVFSGVIAQITEVTPTIGEAGTVTIDCRDYSELFLNTRTSTTMADMVALYEAGATEVDVITRFLTDVGLGSSNFAFDPATAGAGERGTFVIPLAWMDDESPIEECWSVAAACGGWFYSDVWHTSQPYFRYKNASHWALESISTSAPDNELYRSDFGGLQVAYDHNELFRDVTVEYSARKIGSDDVIWEPDNPVIVPAASTKSVTAVFRTPVYAITALTYSAATAGGIDISAAVSDDLSSATAYAQRVEITFTNAHATYAAVLKNVKMTGKPVEGGPEGERTHTSTHSYWSGRTDGLKSRAIRSNLWLQTETQADVLSNMLMDVHEQPVAVYTLTGVPGDPRRKLGQKIRIYDETAFDTANEKAYIVSLDATVGRNGYRQNIIAMDSEAIGYRYAETDPTYFVLGTNRISTSAADAGSNRGRLFY